jgi:hypothetical protein
MDVDYQCRLSRRLIESGRVMTTLEWLQRHREHGEIAEQDAGWPSGTARWLVCECGAKHLCPKTETERA